MQIDSMPAAVSIFGAVSALLNGMMQVIIMLVKERRNTNGNGQHHHDSLASEMRFQIIQNDMKGVKDDLNRLESAIKDVAHRAEGIDRTLLTISVGRR